MLEKSFELFPNSEYLRNQWIKNQDYLKSIGKLNTGGWLVDGGKFLPEFKFSSFK
jgi:hypothetical protein